MKRRGSREWRPKGHEERNGPLVVDHWWSPPPHLSLPLSSPAVLMFCSFLIANTTTRSDNVESLQLQGRSKLLCLIAFPLCYSDAAVVMDRLTSDM